MDPRRPEPDQFDAWGQDRDVTVEEALEAAERGLPSRRHRVEFDERLGLAEEEDGDA